MEGLVFLSCSEDKTYFYYVIDEENEDGDNVEKRTDTYNFMCSMVNGTYKECIGEAECKAEAEAAAAAAAAEL